MQLRINIKLNRPCTLPINYNHILQATIYNLLGGSDGVSNYIHDVGYRYDGRQYRMFTFSPLVGKYSIDNKAITFFDTMGFELRSPNAVFILKAIERINDGKLRLGNADIREISVETTDRVIQGGSVYIRMKAPITVHLTEEDSNVKRYCMPSEDVFYDLICENFIHKFSAYYECHPVSEIRISPFEGSSYRKMVTSYKQVAITAWFGSFLLEGDPAHLTFLYNAGLGSENAKGFGMFDIDNRQESRHQNFRN